MQTHVYIHTIYIYIYTHMYIYTIHTQIYLCVYILNIKDSPQINTESLGKRWITLVRVVGESPAHHLLASKLTEQRLQWLHTLGKYRLYGVSPGKSLSKK